MDDTASTAPRGELFDVSGGAMLLHRSGTGDPPVVFLAGGGMSGLYYWNVHDLVAEFTTSVIHDRLGLGWSDAVDLPRSGAQVTDDLRELLRAAAVPGPYLLVGHSLGGLHARLYAKRFPAEVAGLVLLDPTHEDIADYLPEQEARRLRNWNTDPSAPHAEQVNAMRSAYRAAFDRALTGWPGDIREPLLDRAFGDEGYRRSLREPLNLRHLFDEVRDAGSEPDVPLIVVSAMGPDPIADELAPPGSRDESAESGRAKHRLYSDLAAARPRAEIRRLDDAGHSNITWSRPDAVVRAIRDVLTR
ncbi:alpha/beta hydrolase [Saccharopolyspora sp. NFXS83]|uniref:alpha/beta fold hydrolase n=1 Tax=Saccharopolyspora sp. NFXS83 TaxID=2993560 RepID=UPI00224A4BED|nr:alpha/beta hydrolase [Saccharopolyspora sp. NFXS83]MCX2731896.1 alpha/beta hydrolase [Saccharopolyspora sp. NFXS83]